MKSYGLENIIILKLNDFSVSSIEDVKQIMNQRNTNEPVKMTFASKGGEVNTFIFR